MQNQTTDFYRNINPLVGVSAKTLRLYVAFEVFRSQVDSLEKPEWFRTPNRDEVLGKAGFTKTDIDTGISELIAAKLLEIQYKNSDQWYCLK